MTLYADATEHETFLQMYSRVSSKYEWQTLAWVLMKNHHHFIVELTNGGLSEGFRELHGGYSRWRHRVYGQTRKGHLFRHAFFSRELQTTDDLVRACVYVDLNPAAKRRSCGPRKTDWGGLAATIGRIHPRPFHSPSADFSN